MEILLAAAVATLVVVASVVAWRSAARAKPARREAAEPVPTTAGTLTIHLDLVIRERGDPRVDRLSHEAAARVLATSQSVKEVVVLDRAGTFLRRETRTAPVGAPAGVPPDLLQPHARPSRSPQVVRPSRPAMPGVSRDFSPADAPHRTIAERFDLPDDVLEELRDADDSVDVVRAILVAAHLPATVRDNVVLSGDTAIIVVGGRHGLPPQMSALSRAFLQFQESRARHGVVVIFGYVDPADARRRELLVPALQHVGPEAIQRMADAVALGTDPLPFASRPALAVRLPT